MDIKISSSKFNSKIGILYYLWLLDEEDEERIVFLGNNEDEFTRFIPNLAINENKSLKIEKTLIDFLNGKSKVIDIKPYFLTESAFLKNVWSHTILIPYGSSVSYKELARRAGYPLAWRAVGTAMKKNPVMLVVPCHRVVKSNGDIGNYGGGVKVKKFLLDMESSN